MFSVQKTLRYIISNEQGSENSTSPPSLKLLVAACIICSYIKTSLHYLRLHHLSVSQLLSSSSHYYYYYQLQYSHFTNKEQAGKTFLDERMAIHYCHHMIPLKEMKWHLKCVNAFCPHYPNQRLFQSITAQIIRHTLLIPSLHLFMVCLRQQGLM